MKDDGAVVHPAHSFSFDPVSERHHEICGLMFGEFPRSNIVLRSLNEYRMSALGADGGNCFAIRADQDSHFTLDAGDSRRRRI